MNITNMISLRIYTCAIFHDLRGIFDRGVQFSHFVMVSAYQITHWSVQVIFRH